MPHCAATGSFLSKRSPFCSVNPTNYDAIPTRGDEDGLFHAVIETPAQTRQKYAFEPKFGLLMLKQTLAEGLAWPYDYGFIPQTLADDGDPTDVVVLSDPPNFPGSLLQVRILGAVLLKKDGTVNNRLIAAPKRQVGVALKTDAYDEIEDLPREMMDGIARFLVEYSEDSGHKIKLKGICGRKQALKLIEEDHKRHKKQRSA